WPDRQAGRQPCVRDHARRRGHAGVRARPRRRPRAEGARRRRLLRAGVNAVRILVTRPEPDAERTAQKLRARGCEVVLAPVLRMGRLDQGDLGAGPWDAVAMTSANAAHALARHARRLELVRLPVLTVGRRTAEAARTAGFTDIASADGNEQTLARLIG